MTTHEPLDDVSVTTYEVAVPLDLSVFDTLETAKLTLAETAADSIVANVDELTDDDTPYVTTQVSFNEDGLRDAFNDDDVGIATVQTRTELALIEDDE
jgi:hypothetical protein